MAKTPEGDVKKNVRKILKSLPRTWFFMPVGGADQERSISDFLGVTNGRLWAIETKKDANTTPGLGQRLFLAKIRRARGVAIVAHNKNLDVVEARLRALL